MMRAPDPISTVGYAFAFAGAVVGGAAWWCKAVWRLVYKPLP